MIKENVLPVCQWPQNKLLEDSLALSHDSPHIEHCSKSHGPAGSQVSSLLKSLKQEQWRQTHAIHPFLSKTIEKQYSERSHWKCHEDAELLVRSKN